jgi:hypothetical protein
VRGKGGLFLGAAFSTLLWAIGCLVGWNRVEFLVDREEKREIGVTEAGYYFFDGNKSTRCTETNASGTFVFGPDQIVCEFNTPGFRSALESAQSVFLIMGIVFFVLFAIYLGLGLTLYKKGGASKKREAEL